MANDGESQDYIESELFLTWISIITYAIIGLMALVILVKMCMGAKHRFFVSLIILQICGCLLTEMGETSYIVAVKKSNHWREDP